ncbi:MAG: hypothetical protein ACRDA4_06340 [Filifactoraceae bacterium]
MRKIYLLTLLILVSNYIFFVDSFKSEIADYKHEIEELSNIKYKVSDNDIEVLNVIDGTEVIETVEKELITCSLTSIYKLYMLHDDKESKIHELNYILEGDKKSFSDFISCNIFERGYKLKEACIYSENGKELIKLSITVRSL